MADRGIPRRCVRAAEPIHARNRRREDKSRIIGWNFIDMLSAYDVKKRSANRAGEYEKNTHLRG